MLTFGSRPLLLDTFCKAGGCAMGYYRAGFDVLGVDIEYQPRYPFHFVQAEAIGFIERHGHRFDVIHASPPCQAYSSLRHVCKHVHFPDLLAETREALKSTGRPYVIENVPGAPLNHAIMLCGNLFGLRTYRHRWFESSAFLWQPEHKPHRVRTNKKKERRKQYWEAGGFVTVVGDVGTYVGPEAMGINWMTGDELSQAIPPAYTHYLGRQLINILGA